MNSTNPWDDPDIAGGGDFIRFENKGDLVTGTVVAVQKGQDFNGAPCPQLIIRLDSGEDKTLTAGQAQLAAKLRSLRPMPGWRIAVRYDGPGEAKAGKSPVKMFTVETTPPGGGDLAGAMLPPQQAAPVAAPAGAGASLLG